MMSALALILFFLMLISYIQNLITGNDLQNTQELLDDTRSQVSQAQIELSALSDELKRRQDEIEDYAIQITEQTDTIEAQVKEYTAHTHLLFSLESLRNLANNGRVSPAVAKIAGILGIRVVGRASDVGTLEQLHKCPGERKAVAAIYNEMKKEGYAGGKVRMDHCFNDGIANALKELIIADYPGADIIIGENRGLCCFYAELGGMLVGYEDNK